MKVDVVCAGPPFLDLVFRGLSRIPRAGEEALATDFVMLPGAMANVAFAMRQLGLDAVVCSPKGMDPAGRLLQELMADAGVPWIGEPTESTSVSVALPIDGDRAFVTVMSDAAVDLDAIEALAPRAVVVNLPLPGPMPSTTWTYGVVGDPQVAILRDRGMTPLTELRALFVNEPEARDLTGLPNPLEAAKQIAARGCCLVVLTRAAHGAAAVTPDGHVREAVPVAAQPRDTVGAGDLLTAAFIWADLLGRPVDERLNLATAYASLSLAQPAPRQKGLTAEAVRDALAASVASMHWLKEV